MNTGTCKYGDDCKYSHPKERLLQSPPNLLNPIVLPARPVSLLSFIVFCQLDISAARSVYFVNVNRALVTLISLLLLCSGTTSMW